MTDLRKETVVTNPPIQTCETKTEWRGPIDMPIHPGVLLLEGQQSSVFVFFFKRKNKTKKNLGLSCHQQKRNS